MAKHTSGDWKVDPRVATRIVSDSGRGVASTGGPFSNQEEDGGTAENEANARFIAAAPEIARQRDELWGALRTLRTLLNAIGVACVKADVAIANTEETP